MGDASKAKKVLNWKPKVSFKELISMMVDADYKRLTMSPKKLMEQKICF